MPPVEIERLRLLRFYRRTDGLESPTYIAIEPAITRKLAEDQNLLTNDDVENIILSVPDIEHLMRPGIFKRFELFFRMPHNCLTIYNTDPVPGDFLQYFKLDEKETRNLNLHGRIWFLLLIGTTPDDVGGLYAKQRELQTEFNASYTTGCLPDKQGSQSSAHVSLSQNRRTVSLSVPGIDKSLHNPYLVGFQAQYCQGAQALQWQNARALDTASPTRSHQSQRSKVCRDKMKLLSLSVADTTTSVCQGTISIRMHDITTEKRKCFLVLLQLS